MLTRAVFAGGGTGGHIYPGLAVADALRPHGVECTFVGTRRGVEATAVPKAGYVLKLIHARGLSRRPALAARAVASLTMGCLQSYKLLGKIKPQLVIGTGGYACAPVLFAAALRRIPSLVLEQNAYPGKTTRYLSRMAARVCISFPDSAPYFPKDKVVVTGNPVRAEILGADRAASREQLGLSDDRPTLLVTGASQGATSLNEAVLAALPAWKEREWNIIHLTGPKCFQDVLARGRAALGTSSALNYRCLGFSHEMAALYASADLVVCRAGATTLAEVTGRGLPSVLVPYPFAAANHQDKNARSLVSAGAAEMLKDDEVLAGLEPAVTRLFADPVALGAMGAASARLGRPDALAHIVAEISRLCGGLGGKTE